MGPFPDLLKRILSGLLLIPAFLTLTYLGGMPFLIAIEVIALLALIEWTRIFGAAGIDPLRAAVIPATLALPVWAHLGGDDGSSLLLVLILALILIGTVRILRGLGQSSFTGLALAWAAVVYLGLLLGTFVLVRRQLGWELLFLVYITVWLGDSAAYFVGHHWGRRQLAPRISPNKTWEGGVAAFLVSPFIALGLDRLFGLDGAVLPLLLLGLVIALAGLVGDLTESMLKRQFALKDTSALIPGHGGALDRLDSLLFAVPAAYCYYTFVAG